MKRVMTSFCLGDELVICLEFLWIHFSESTFFKAYDATVVFESR